MELPASAQLLLSKLLATGAPTFLFGECVRDLLLARKPEFWEVVTPVSDTALRQMFPVVNKIVPGAYVVYPDRAVNESYDVLLVEPDDMETTQYNSDFTMDSLLLDPVTNNVIDPLDGLRDIGLKMITTVGDPETILARNPMCGLKAIRLYLALNFTIHPLLSVVMQDNDYHRLLAGKQHPSKWTELQAMLLLDRPDLAFGGLLAYKLLDACGLEALGALEGVTQNKEYHQWDVWGHTMVALSATPRKISVRLAALFHDIGKSLTRTVDNAGKIHFDSHATVSADIADSWMSKMHLPTTLRHAVCEIVRHHEFRYDNSWSRADVRRFISHVRPDFVYDQISLAIADWKGHGTPGTDREINNLEHLRIRVSAELMGKPVLRESELAIDTAEIMRTLGLTRNGPLIDKIRGSLLEAVLDDPTLNEKVALEALVSAMVPHINSNDGKDRKAQA